MLLQINDLNTGRINDQDEYLIFILVGLVVRLLPQQELYRTLAKEIICLKPSIHLLQIKRQYNIHFLMKALHKHLQVQTSHHLHKILQTGLFFSFPFLHERNLYASSTFVWLQNIFCKVHKLFNSGVITSNATSVLDCYH